MRLIEIEDYLEINTEAEVFISKYYREHEYNINFKISKPEFLDLISHLPDEIRELDAIIDNNNNLIIY